MSAADADVLVVGGGPSGVAAAIELRRQGRRVILLDREPALGGATRHCAHSPFGMLEFGRVYFGAAYGRKLTREAEKAGVDIRTGHSVVELGEGSLLVTAGPGVEKLTAERILVTTGAREKPRSVRLLSGDRPIGVVTTGTLQSYLAFHGLLPFRRPLIVGSELVEPRAHALARAPLAWFPSLMGIPFHRGAEIVDILGRGRVEAVTIRRAEKLETLDCDGVLLTGQFTPESALFLQSALGIDPGSAGPAVDQQGRSLDPRMFAAGNVLRAVETGGWAFREGRAIGKAIAEDFGRDPEDGAPVPVTFDAPVKLVVPNILRRASSAPAFRQFQLRVLRRVRGRLSLTLDGREVWQARGLWMPERRILVPIPADAPQAQNVHFRFREED